MAGALSLSILFATSYFSIMSSVAALRLPFVKRDNATVPPLTTLPMPIHFDSNGRYAIQAQMGNTNPQAFNFSLSTGSGLTFVAGQSCSDCTNTPLYNQNASASAVSLSRKDNTTFFGQMASGQVIKESCGAKLANGSQWAYPNQTCVVVDSQSSTSLLGGGISGIFGLGTNGGANGSSSSGLSFADSIYSQWLSRNPTRGNFSFGMMLMPPVIEPKAGTQAGTLHWTKPDQSFYHPEKVTVKPIVDTSSNNTDQTDITLNSGQDWTVGLDGWTAAVNNTHLSNTDAVVAVVDPLYPNIYLPGDQAKIIYDAIRGSSVSSASTLSGLSQAYSIPCNTQFSFGFVVGTQTFVMSPEQLVLPQGDGTCLSAVEGLVDSGATQYIVGARFISTIYLIFNIPRSGTPSLGFSPRANPSNSSNVGAIVGGTIGGVALVIIAGLAAFLFFRRRTDGYRHKQFGTEETEKLVRHNGVEPYLLRAPLSARSSVISQSLLPTQPLSFAEEEVHIPPPSYDEILSNVTTMADSNVASRLPPRDVKAGY